MSLDQIDLICGSSWGEEEVADKELGAVREVFGDNCAIPLVNYNGHFGFVESSAALLNLAVLLNVMEKGTIPPIPYTDDYRDTTLAFVRAPLQKEVRTVLLIGTSDGGNNYAVIVRKGLANV